jgi:hypothetical protein
LQQRRHAIDALQPPQCARFAGCRATRKRPRPPARRGHVAPDYPRAAMLGDLDAAKLVGLQQDGKQWLHGDPVVMVMALVEPRSCIVT